MLLLIAPNLFHIQADWGNPAIPFVIITALFLLLLAIAVLTTRTGRQNQRKFLPVRISTLLEASYASAIAVLFTLGSRSSAESNSAIVSILKDHGVALDQAWFANDTARVALIFIMFFFLVTALVSAVRGKLEKKHRTVSRFQLIRPKDED